MVGIIRLFCQALSVLSLCDLKGREQPQGRPGKRSTFLSTLLRPQLACQQVLDEIQAGVFDGWTYKRIEQERPDQAAERKADKLRYRSLRLLAQ